MKFEITKTSSHSGKPHQDAIEEEYTYLDFRTIPTIKKAKEKHWFKQWFDRGKNHREDLTYNMIVCEVTHHNKLEPFTRWVIEIDNIMDWIDELKGDIVLSPKYINKDSTEPIPKIEIYDYWRE